MIIIGLLFFREIEYDENGDTARWGLAEFLAECAMFTTFWMRMAIP